MNRKLLIKKELTIKKALDKLDEVKPKILFVVENGILTGTLTDGDIRRYFLAGGRINDNVLNACNRKPKRVAHSIEEAILMLDKNYIAIPVVDSRNRLKDIYTGNRVKKSKNSKLNVRVVINAGGKGTRLEPFTKVLPKPLIPVGDLPIIEHIMQKYKDYGCCNFDVIVNYKKELIKAYFRECAEEYKINWIDESKPLGTGGGLSLLKNKIKDTFFFISCDNLLIADYGDIFKYHRKNKYDITMICVNRKIQIPYGVVDIKNNEFNSIKEKPEYSVLTNTAMYVLEPNILKDIKENKKIDFPEIIEIEKKNGKKIGVYTVEEDKWLDMGQLSELEKMRNALYGE